MSFSLRNVQNIDITLNEIENALQKGERVELRDIFTLETRVQKARMSRNPRTNEISRHEGVRQSYWQQFFFKYQPPARKQPTPRPTILVT